MTQSIVADLRDGFRGGRIGEVAMARLDALLDGPGALGVLLEERLVVVGLNQQTVHVAHRLGDQRGGMTEIGQKAEGVSPGANHEADRLDGIMRNKKGSDGRILEGERRSAFKNLPPGEVGHLLAEDGRSLPVAEDRGGMLLRPLRQSLGVVPVFMGYEDRAEITRFDATGGEAKGQFFGAQARIDEEASRLGPHQGGVTAAATGKDGDL